jgi:archaellum component FlaC
MAANKTNLLLVSVLFLMACEQRQQLRGMYNSTDQMNKTTQSMDKTMQDMNQTMKGMSQTMSGMNETMRGMDQKMAGMDNKMGHMNTTMGGMQKTMTNMDGKMGHMTTTMDGMNTTMVKMSGSINVVQTTMGKMNGTMGQMNGTLGGMNTTMTSMNNQLGKVDQKMASLVQKIDGMDGKMGNLVEQITSMNKTLVTLGNDMKAMSGKLDGMSSTMGELLGKMNEIYDVSKPAVASMVRGQSWDHMLGSQALSAKVVEAAKYMMTFEYQIAQANTEKDQEKRLKLANSAAQEYFKKVRDLIDAGPPEDSWIPFTGAPDENVEALAVAMSRVNEIQDEHAEQNSGFQKMTMLSMIEDALKYDQTQTAETAQMPAYIKTILADRELAKWLLKVRMNTLVKMTLGQVSPLVKSQFGIFKTFVLGDWELGSAAENWSVLSEVHQKMKGAVETKKILGDIGEKTQVGMRLRWGLGNMKLPINESSDDPKQKLINDIAVFKRELLEEGPSDGATVPEATPSGEATKAEEKKPIEGSATFTDAEPTARAAEQKRSPVVLPDVELK